MDDSLVKNSYNEIADEYSSKYLHDDFDFPELDKFIKMLPEGAFVLDAGCGPGTFTQHFMKHGFKVEGIDLSEKMLEIAKRNIPFANFKQMDMRKLTYFDGSFDAILAGYSLIHIPHKDIESTLKEFHRVLEEDGLLMIIAQKGEGARIVDEPLKKGVKLFVNFYKLFDWMEMLKKAGFKVLYKKEKTLLDPQGSFSEKVNYLIVQKT